LAIGDLRWDEKSKISNSPGRNWHNGSAIDGRQYLLRAILSHYAPYKLKFKISNLKSVYFVAALSPGKKTGF
jgi:hypothetical protein